MNAEKLKHLEQKMARLEEQAEKLAELRAEIETEMEKELSLDHQVTTELRKGTRGFTRTDPEAINEWMDGRQYREIPNQVLPAGDGVHEYRLAIRRDKIPGRRRVHKEV